MESVAAGPAVLDPFNGDPDETHHPETAWQALATVAASWNRHARDNRTEP
jgi:hypothetical protein